MGLAPTVHLREVGGLPSDPPSGSRLRCPRFASSCSEVWLRPCKLTLTNNAGIVLKTNGKCSNWMYIKSGCLLQLISGLLIFRAVAEPRISSKSAKSREIHKNTRNPVKFARNLTKYMSAQRIWKLSWLLGLLTCCKLANLPWNFVTAASKATMLKPRHS